MSMALLRLGRLPVSGQTVEHVNGGLAFSHARGRRKPDHQQAAERREFRGTSKESRDPGSKGRGGDLDWAAPMNYVKPFSLGDFSCLSRSETPRSCRTLARPAYRATNRIRAAHPHTGGGRFFNALRLPKPPFGGDDGPSIQAVRIQPVAWHRSRAQGSDWG